MEAFNPADLKKLYIPAPQSHKGQNGKLLIIGGSTLFHAASLWALNIASRIVDMVFYSSVKENNDIVHEQKKEFRNGIIVPREHIEDYIAESDAVLIGPGMMRTESIKSSMQELRIKGIKEILNLEDEGEQSYFLTRYLLEKYPHKKWIIDAGALQMMEPEWLIPLNGNSIITPHLGEFQIICSKIKDQKSKIKNQKVEEKVLIFAEEFNCTVLLKGEEDIVSSPEKCIIIKGGNAGMTKGGTGDVLAGLVGALACKNDLWLAAVCAGFLNKKAGESLFQKVGYYFNSSDLADEIPRIMREYL